MRLVGTPIISIIFIVLTACSSPQAPTGAETPIPLSTPTRKNTPIQSVSPSHTPTQKPAITSTPLPRGLIDDILDSYTKLIVTQFTADYISQTAERISSGEIDGFQSFGAMGVATDLIKTMEGSFLNEQNPPYLVTHLERADKFNGEMKDIVARWLDQQINVQQVIDEIQPIKNEVDELLVEVENELAGFNFETEDLTTARADYLQSLGGIVGVETPAEVRLSIDGPIPKVEGFACIPNAERQVGIVIGITDGDTIDVMVGDSYYSVDFLGIDAPEMGGLAGEVARNKNFEMVVGEDVLLIGDESGLDQINSLSRYVIARDVFVNYRLIKLAYASVATTEPGVACHLLFLDAEEKAKTDNLGIWATIE